MYAYLIFGDPRRAERRAVYRAPLDRVEATARGPQARVVLGGQPVDGALLAGAPGTPGPLAVLAAARLPDEREDALLAGSGWARDDAADVPAPDRLPFPAEVTVVAAGPAGLRGWTRPVWMDRLLVGTQRWALPLADGTDLPARCLAMAPGNGEPARALLLAEPGGTLPDLPRLGWLPVPPVAAAPRWELLIRAADAFAARVEYLLQAPVVVAVQPAGPDRVAALDPHAWAEALDPDVLAGAIDALDAAGRAGEVPAAARAAAGGPGGADVIDLPPRP